MKDLYDQQHYENPENLDQSLADEDMQMQYSRPIVVPTLIKEATRTSNPYERTLIWLYDSTMDFQDKNAKELPAKIYSLLWDRPLTFNELKEKLDLEQVYVFNALVELSKLGFLSVFTSNGDMFLEKGVVYFSTNFIKYRNLITTFYTDYKSGRK